jgi:hypothetical protein
MEVTRWGHNKLALLMLTSALCPPLARLPLSVFMTIALFALEDGVRLALWRFILEIVDPYDRWYFDVSQAWVRRSLALYGLKAMLA